MEILLTLGRSLAGLVAVWVALHLVFRVQNDKDPVIIAHRGAASRAPENTLAGIEAGVLSGAPFIEVDVQRTADGVLILMHDATVDRTTDGSGLVADLTYAEMSQLDAGSWFSETFKGEPVPRLDQAFDLLEGWRGTLVVEAKYPARYPGIADDLTGMVKRYSEQPVSVVSFDHGWLASFHEQARQIPLGYLYVYPFDLRPKTGAATIGVFWPSVVIDPTLVRRTKRAGLETWVYTADGLLLRRLLGWLGVHGITTNSP